MCTCTCTWCTVIYHWLIKAFSDLVFTVLLFSQFTVSLCITMEDLLSQATIYCSISQGKVFVKKCVQNLWALLVGFCVHARVVCLCTVYSYNFYHNIYIFLFVGTPWSIQHIKGKYKTLKSYIKVGNYIYICYKVVDCFCSGCQYLCTCTSLYFVWLKRVKQFIPEFINWYRLE